MKIHLFECLFPFSHVFLPVNDLRPYCPGSREESGAFRIDGRGYCQSRRIGACAEVSLTGADRLENGERREKEKCEMGMQQLQRCKVPEPGNIASITDFSFFLTEEISRIFRVSSYSGSMKKGFYWNL